jgi:signal transduction histidine kinase
MLNHILTALDDHVLAYDQDAGQYIFISANLAGLTGHNSDAFKTNPGLWHSLINAKDKKQVMGIPTAQEHLNFDYCITTAQGETKWVSEKRSALVDEETGHSILLSIVKDVTERLKADQSILDKNERLQNIASISSHELRRPVATMLGLINIFDRKNFYNPTNKEIIEHLLTVGKEIDDVIRQIASNAFMID